MSENESVGIIPGKFVWYDLMTSDLDGAAAFYTAVAGWKIADSGMPGQEYRILSAEQGMVGGLMRTPPEAAGAGPGWLGYIGTKDTDAAAKAVQAHGGKVHREPQDIPGIGRFAVVADPQGGGFLLFTPNAGPEAPPEWPRYTQGRIGWHELHAADGDAAFDWYTKMFGWTKTSEFDMKAMGMYHIFAMGGRPVGGIMTKAPQMPVPGWLFYINVDDIHAAADRVRAAGGQVVHEPSYVPDGSVILHGIDPQGARFALVAEKKI